MKTLLIPAAEMQETFLNILLRQGYTNDRAEQLASVFTQNSIDGIYTHGLNRFPRFIEYTQKGYVQRDAVPELKFKNNGIEQWDGNLGPGILNALHATDQSMKLADDYGIGCVGLRNTNHWMRGGTYGWKASSEEYIFIAFTNTIANMPAYGAKDAKLGNNPLVLGAPYGDSAVVLDMAMSQYSYGSMELAAMQGRDLPEFGGYDTKGNVTKDPKEILASGRPLPVGYWKGAGLSLLLDVFTTLLSGGLSTHEITQQPAEYGLSQVFISIKVPSPGSALPIANIVENIIRDYKQSIPANSKSDITYPGERVLRARKKNQEYGIPVLEEIWNKIQRL